MKTREDSYTSQLTFREAALQSTAMQEAEMMALSARSRNGILTLLDGSRKAQRAHEDNMLASWYADEHQSLDLMLTSRRMALREQLNHWLQQGGLYLRRQTAEAALQEYRALDEQIALHLRATYTRARELKLEADSFADVPSIHRRFLAMLEDMLQHSDLYVQQLMHEFKAMLQERL